VELNEAARRIFLQHWWLIVVGVIAGAAIGLVVAGTSHSYRASARLVIDTPDPSVTSQSTAIADTVRAIATSPSLMQEARTTAAASSGGPVQLGANDISVTPLGNSGVLSLAVKANSKDAAASLANALANEVIQMRLHIANGQSQLDAAKLTKRINALSTRIAALDSSVAATTRRLAGASAAKQAALEAQLGNQSQQRDLLTQQRGILQSEQATLLGGTSGRPTPTVISPAAASGATAAGTSSGSSMVLGALLGLVVALLVAALLEAVRPTLVGGEAVARELGKPHLGTFSVDGSGQLGAARGIEITHLLRESAREAHVAKIDLLGIGSTVDLALIAGALDSAVATQGGGGPAATGAHQPASASRAITVRPFGLREVAEGKGTGLAVIAPAILKRSELADAMRLLRTTPWPLLGVMTYKPSRRKWWSSLISSLSPAGEKTEGAATTGTEGQVRHTG
jgi:capsular polysaccharide biosynthesis protein